MRSFIYLLVLCLLASCANDKGKKKELPSKEEIITIKSIRTPSDNNSQTPRLFGNGESLYFSWVTQKDSMDVLNYAVLNKGEWSATEEIIRGNDWFTNWADFPNIAENNGRILTSFLQKSDSGTYTYDVKLNLYHPDTKQWKKNFILHNDGTKSEHGFVSIKPYAYNSFVVTWLDGRETVGKGHGGGQMTLRAAIVFEDGTIDHDTLLDEKVCDCCNTALAIGHKDQILVTYRDRSDDEIRDISITDWTMESNWSAPRSVGDDQWKIAGCPVNGPAMDAVGENVAVAWFTANDGEGKVQLTFSKDSGKTFEAPMRIDAGNATGRVDIVMLSETDAAVLWMEPQGEDEMIQLAIVNDQGAVVRTETIAKTSAARASGFPQLEKVGDALYMAWTVVGEKDSHIEMATLELDLK